MFDQSQSPYAAGRAVAFDEGLRAQFRNVYTMMSIGLLITGAVAFLVSNSPAMVQLMFGTPLKWVMMFAPMVFVMFGFSPNSIMRRSAGQLKTLFYVFSAVFGLCLSSVFLVFAGTDIARALFITAAMFAGMSIFGYTTKADLSRFGSFLLMGALGLLLAIVVNLFLQSTMMQFIISVAGVLIYTVMVAFDTQNIKESYAASYGQEANGKAAVLGALSLYMNIIMIFQFMLSLLGNNRE